MRRLILAILLAVTFISAKKCLNKEFIFPDGAICDSVENCEQCTTRFTYKVGVEFREIAYKSIKTKRHKITASETYDKKYDELDTNLRKAISSSSSGTASNSNSNSNKSSSETHDKGSKSSSSRQSGSKSNSNSRSTSAAVSVKGWGVRASASASHSRSNSNSESHDNSNQNSESHDKLNKRSDENHNSESNYRSDSAAKAVDLQQARRMVQESEDKVKTHKESLSVDETVYQDDAINVYRTVKLILCIDSDCHENESSKIIATEFRGERDGLEERRKYWDEEAIRYINHVLKPANVIEIPKGSYPHLEYSFEIIEDYCHNNAESTTQGEKLTLANPRWGSNGLYWTEGAYNVPPRFAIDGQWAKHSWAEYTGFTHSGGINLDNNHFYVDLPKPNTPVSKIILYTDPRPNNKANYYKELKVKVGNTFCNILDPVDDASFPANRENYRMSGINIDCNNAVGGVIELDFGTQYGSLAEIVAYPGETEKLNYCDNLKYDANEEQDTLMAPGWAPVHHDNGIIEVDAACKETGASFTRVSFQLVKEKGNWFNARDKCAALGKYSSLAAIYSKQEADLILALGASTNVWLGGHDSAVEGKWKWEVGRDGYAEPFCYKNWNSASSEPNNAGSDEDCVVSTTTGLWYDVNCYVEYEAYICQTRQPAVSGWAAVDGYNYIPVDSACEATGPSNTKVVFQLFLESGDWYNARDKCAALGHGASLAAIYSRAEAELVLALAPGYDAWLGGNDEENEGQWKWLSGRSGDAEDICYEWWYSATSEPNNAGGDEDCMMRNVLGSWNDANCKTVKPAYVCQIRW